MAVTSRAHRADWYDPAWRRRKKVVIGRARVLKAEQKRFLVSVSLKDAALKSADKGGYVVGPQGEDLLFTSSDGTTRLDHDTEKYDPATGCLKVRVRVPARYPAVDSVLYLYYGNPARGGSMEVKEIIERAKEGLLSVMNLELSSVTRVSRADEGWEVVMELVERKAIPDAQDLLGEYEVRLDESGRVTSYGRRRVRRRMDVEEVGV